ncbi:MAG: 2-oxoglutarate/2-oxoacid ferredoxin oxidoreductase subunit beta [Candidatus Atribacteria bacterium]|nr:2-oxoglutarate/2-oxoacid ferredoxin oxidoreductase subunit beta [Candidatus Atribacteria bacterium]
MAVVFERPKTLIKKPFTYCPGCHHGLAQRIIAEVIDELGIENKTIGVGPVGCSVYIYQFLDTDFVMGAHGRAPAIATGIKRTQPDKIVFSYQGDGDIAAIGTAEILHAANRGELISSFFINNAVFGMTGGQMAPTTILKQKTTTSPKGREPKSHGFPLQLCEVLSACQGSAYLSRVALTNPKLINQAKRSIKKALLTQIEGRGFSLVEILSPCPTNWGMSPQEAVDWLEKEMIPYYPLGEIAVKEGILHA